MPSQPVHRRTTVKDIAQSIGVSTSTVSRVLNDTETKLISKKTKMRVIDAAARLKYSPNPLARALKGKQTYLLGLIVREIADPFFASFISKLSNDARNSGYQIVLGHAHSDPQEAIQIGSILDSRHLDGLFIMGDLQEDINALELLVRNNPATVAMCRGQSPSWIPKVNVDNFAGVEMVMDYLLRLGHRRITFIDGGWLGDIRERCEAFEQFVKKHNLEQTQIVKAPVNDATGGYKAMTELINLSSRPTAVFAADDLMAVGALKAANDARISVPEGLSIVGFDEIEIGHFVTPTLTTVRQSIEDMSRKAMELMVKLIEQKEVNCQKIILVQPELVIRNSCGPVNRT